MKTPFNRLAATGDDRTFGPLVWFQSLRAYSLPMSIFPPVIVFLLAVTGRAEADGPLFSLFLLCVLLLHVGTNVLNDYHDHCSGVDGTDSPGPSGVIQRKKAPPSFMLTSGTLYFICACACSLPIVLSRPAVLLPGCAGVVAAYFYTNRHFSLKYHFLGEPTVFLLFGPLLFIAAAFGFTSLSWKEVFPVSVPFGLYPASVLLINNIRDRRLDGEAGIGTLPMLLGTTYSKTLFLVFFIASLVLMNLAPAAGGTGRLLMPPVSLAVAVIVTVLSFKRNISTLPTITALLHLPLSLLYIVRIVW
ncbi:MAG: prenyltransferase [Chitinispirillaceae bacterium]|nr:prenyltransferase [Chitinispirillaceae bacterium]